MNHDQKEDRRLVFGDIQNLGDMDYVCCWYKKAAEMMNARPEIKTALVSTNSITQGEQVAILWKPLFEQYHIHIDFAYRTFRWDNKAKAKAKVHCVIIGFSCVEDRRTKVIYDESGRPEIAQNINPYLVNAPTVYVISHSKTLCDVPQIRFGSMPRDGGHFILTEEEKNTIELQEPFAKKWIKLYLGAKEFINNKKRWCLWLKNANPSELNQCEMFKTRIALVKSFRENSVAAGTRKFAQTPSVFCQIAQPDSDYIAIPKTSSSNRYYLPMGFLSSQVIASDLIFLIPNATLYHFGVLMSSAHNAWMRSVCGRLKSDYRYSKDIVYNNFPWCEPTDKQKADIEKTAQAILDARAHHPDCSLADLYNETIMPPELRKAHLANDHAVLRAYGLKTDISEKTMVEYLFRKYSELTKHI